MSDSTGGGGTGASASASSSSDDAAGCQHPIIYHGLCASCGADLTQAAASRAAHQGHANRHASWTDASSRGAFGSASAAPSSSSSSSSSSSQAAQAIVLGGAHKTIHLTPAALRDTAKRNSLTLLRTRRLLCVLDLDHTLLHATSDARVAPFVGREEDLFSFELPAGPHSMPAPPPTGLQRRKQPQGVARPGFKTHYVKLRPGLATFLETLARLFDFHVYTMGVRAYADAVVGVLDPTHRLIKHRIVSRDEAGAGGLGADGVVAPSAVAKSLKKIHPCDENLVVIVDDRVDVWGREQGRNVLRAFEYQYFNGRGEMNSRPQASAAQTAQAAAMGGGGGGGKGAQHSQQQQHQQRESGIMTPPPSFPLLPPKRSKEFEQALAAAAAAGPPLPTPPLASPTNATPSPVASAASPTASAPAAAAATASGGGSKLRRRKAPSAPSAAPVDIQVTHELYPSRYAAAAAAAIAAASAAATAVDPIVLDADGGDEGKESDRVNNSSTADAAPSRMEIDGESSSSDHAADSSATPSAAPTPASAPAASSSSDPFGLDLLSDHESAELKALDAAIDLTDEREAALPPSASSLAQEARARAERERTPYDVPDQSLLPIYPYMFSAHPCPDNVLLSLTAVLRAVHSLFFEGIEQQQATPSVAMGAAAAAAEEDLLPLSPAQSIPRLLGLLKRSTLLGCVIVFSGVFPTVKNAAGVSSGAQKAEAWIQATSFGATCLEEFPEVAAKEEEARRTRRQKRGEEEEDDDNAEVPIGSFGQIRPPMAQAASSSSATPLRVTHVVAARDGSAKLRYAHALPSETKPHIVHVSWLWHSIAHFQRGEESKFPLWPEGGAGAGAGAQAKQESTRTPSPVARNEATGTGSETTADTAVQPAATSGAPDNTAAAASAAAPAATSSSGAPLRRRIPKKAAPVAAPDTTSSSAAAGSAASTPPAAAAASSTPAASSSAPVPGTVGLHLVHHVAVPPTPESLVARVRAMQHAEAEQSNRGRGDAELTRAAEMVKASRLRESMRARRMSDGGQGQASPAAAEAASASVENGSAAAASPSRRRKSVSFRDGQLELGPTNPHYHSSAHTPPDYGVSRVGVGASLKRKPLDAPLDDVERAKRERSEMAGGGAAAARHVIHVSDDGGDISAEELYAQPDYGVDGGDDDAAFDELTDSLFDELDQADGGDYEDEGRFDDDE